MKTKIKFFLLLVFCFATANSLFAGSDLISPNDLMKIMRDKNTVIVSARPPADYQKVHIPGAVNIYHMDLYKEPAINGLIKPAGELAVIFGKKGISQNNTIVLYDAGSGKYAGRLYWIFKYMGVQNVRILNGQLKGWRAARKPVTRTPVTKKPVTFIPNVKNEFIATTSYVQKNIKNNGVVIIDVRSQEEYKGIDETVIRKGHIPGALNCEYKHVLNDDATIKSTEELMKLCQKNGVTKDKEVIVYCKTSVRAGIVFFTLKDLMGFPKVRVYDDAFWGWQSIPDNPVTP